MAKQAKRWSKKLTDLVNKRKKAKGKEKADIQKQINEEYKRLGMNSKGEVVRSNDAKAGMITGKQVAKGMYKQARKAGVPAKKAEKMIEPIEGSKEFIRERKAEVNKIASNSGILGVINSNKDLQRDLNKMISDPNRSVKDVIKQIKAKAKKKGKKNG